MIDPLADTPAILNILELYQQGMSISALSKATGEPYTVIRSILAKRNVPLRSRADSTRRGADHPSSKLSEAQREELYAALRSGEVKHKVLADQFHVSRERIRQLAKRINAPTGKEIRTRLTVQRIHQRKEMIEASRERAREAREARLAVWREMWANGATLREIADKLGLSPISVGVRITELRKLHPDWFPYRRHHTAGPQPKQP